MPRAASSSTSVADCPLLVRPDELASVVAGGQFEVEVVEAEVAQQPEHEGQQVLELGRACSGVQ